MKNRLLSCLFAAVSLFAGVAHADMFPWYDDPNSTPVFNGPYVKSGNTLAIGVAVKNTGTTAHWIAVLNPIFNTLVGGVAGNLVWDDALDGWKGTENGNPLLVTVNSPSRFPWSEVANFSGTAQDSETVFGQTTNPSARYPFWNYGVVAPGATTPFIDFVYTFHWGGTGTGTVRSNGLYESIAPNPSAVPEPASVVFLGSVALFLGFLQLRNRRRIRE